MEPAQTVKLNLPDLPMALFAPLWGSGVTIRATTGTDLKRLLCDQLGIDPDYLEHRLQTILVNGHPVDHVSQWRIADGDVIALSAAMPGLVGTTLRKGGHLAAMRADISQNKAAQPVSENQRGTVTLKLFNMVAREIGPRILSAGILLSGTDAAELIEKLPTDDKPAIAAGPSDWVALYVSVPD